MINRNTSINLDMNRIFDLKGENTNLVSDIIQPTVEIKRICNICRAGGGTNTTPNTIYTTPADKDFYLTAAQISFSKDAGNTTNQVALNVTIEGVSRQFLILACTSSVQQNDSIAQNFPNPVKIDRNTSITLTSTNVTAVIRLDATIQGYTTETIKGA